MDGNHHEICHQSLRGSAIRSELIALAQEVNWSGNVQERANALSCTGVFRFGSVADTFAAHRVGPLGAISRHEIALRSGIPSQWQKIFQEAKDNIEDCTDCASCSLADYGVEVELVPGHSGRAPLA